MSPTSTRLRDLLASALVTAVALPAMAACDRSDNLKVVVVQEDEAEEEKPLYDRPSEEELRKQFEARKEARENQPEPELDPNEPREKFELVWKMGKGKLDSIYAERAEMIAMLRRTKLEDKAEKKLVGDWPDRLTEFGIGRTPEELESAADEVCKIIAGVRGPAEKLISDGRAELEKVADKEKEYDAKADAGGTVYQQQWDKIDEQRTRWSAPVKAGKQMLLVAKSILQEAEVLVEHGPRRAQRTLRDCLKPMLDKPLMLDLAQEQLEKTQRRARWYRDLR